MMFYVFVTFWRAELGAWQFANGLDIGRLGILNPTSTCMLGSVLSPGLLTQRRARFTRKPTVAMSRACSGHNMSKCPTLHPSVAETDASVAKKPRLAETDAKRAKAEGASVVSFSTLLDGCPKKPSMPTDEELLYGKSHSVKSYMSAKVVH